MRKIGFLGLTAAALAGSAIVGCGNDKSISSDDTAALGFALVGDGHALVLDGAPADPTRHTTYPLGGLTRMNVKVSTRGDLTATCEAASGKVACQELPFFSHVTRLANGSNLVQVYDLYGYKLVDQECNPGGSAGDGDAAAPLPPPKEDGGSYCSSGGHGSGGSCGSGAGGGSEDGGGYTTGGGGSGGNCKPEVMADCGGCMLTIGSTNCDCSDSSCVKSALAACGGYTTSGGGDDDTGGGDQHGAGNGDHGGGGYTTGGNSGGGSGNGGGYQTSGTCDQTTLDNAKKQFCADIDAWLKANGITTPVDCSKVNDTQYDVTNPPADHKDYKCREIIHDGWVKVRATLAACDPAAYVNWESSSRWELLQQGDCRGSPLVLDLDGDGVRLSSLETGVGFDLLGTGEKVQTAWTRGDDALLAIDWNNDGAIGGAAELFGNATFGREHDDGFRALAELDANNDGRVDAKDPAFAELVAWRDADHDGLSRPSELVALRDAGIRAIDLAPTRLSGPASFDESGNDVSLVSRFVRDDGRSGVIVDAWLRFKPMR